MSDSRLGELLAGDCLDAEQLRHANHWSWPAPRSGQCKCDDPGELGAHPRTGMHFDAPPQDNSAAHERERIAAAAVVRREQGVDATHAIGVRSGAAMRRRLSPESARATAASPTLRMHRTSVPAHPCQRRKELLADDYPLPIADHWLD